ncbi:hypothetical protein D3C84_366430 [compost metagenome]|jgi:serine/threonine-protein phosphatase Stp1
MSIEYAKTHSSAHAPPYAVGVADQLTLDVLELGSYPGDEFLLCCDGQPYRK